jgi:hypothetical protein
MRSHTLIGEPLAKLEMRVILEELVRRLPHIELVTDQSGVLAERDPIEAWSTYWSPGILPRTRSPGTATDFASGCGTPAADRWVDPVNPADCRTYRSPPRIRTSW